MRIFKMKGVAKFVLQERIADASLREAIERAERGLIDADLGSGLIKLRIARQGQGRSGGYRTIVAYRAGNMAVFLYAFAKNDRQNIEPDELLDFRYIAAELLTADDAQIKKAIESDVLQEISHD